MYARRVESSTVATERTVQVNAERTCAGGPSVRHEAVAAVLNSVGEILRSWSSLMTRRNP